VGPQPAPGQVYSRSAAGNPAGQQAKDAAALIMSPNSCVNKAERLCLKSC